MLLTSKSIGMINRLTILLSVLMVSISSTLRRFPRLSVKISLVKSTNLKEESPRDWKITLIMMSAAASEQLN